VDADNIRVVTQERAVTVKAANGDRLYETSVPLDVPIVRKMVKRTFNNGVLEVTFKEKAKPRRIDAKGGLGQQ
jgi:HSP20 family molecular chaperone IbpA